jgi:hypothetical protein
MNDDMRRADDAQRGIPADPHAAAEESIWDHSLIPAPLGTPGDFGRYNNAIVYFFSLLGLFQVVFWPIPFGLVAIGIAAYRILRHRPHAGRGLVVAVLATCVGLLPFALA